MCGNVRWLVVEIRLFECFCSGWLMGEILCGIYGRLVCDVWRIRSEDCRWSLWWVLSVVGIVVWRFIYGDIDRDLIERCDKWIDWRGWGDLILVCCDVLIGGE